MVEADFSGDYLNVENCEDGAIGIILGEAIYVEKDFNGAKKEILDIPVEINKVKKTYSPFRETGQKFVAAWGKETKNWVGKKFKVFHVKYSAFGHTKIKIEAEPLKE